MRVYPSVSQSVRLSVFLNVCRLVTRSFNRGISVNMAANNLQHTTRNQICPISLCAAILPFVSSFQMRSIFSSNENCFLINTITGKIPAPFSIFRSKHDARQTRICLFLFYKHKLTAFCQEVGIIDRYINKT